MPKPPPKQTERARCDYCQQWQYCRRVRKAKRTWLGKIAYVFVWLCEVCVYEIEIM